MKQILLFTILFFCINTIQAQKHDDIWLIGQETTSSTKLDFNSGFLQIDSVIRNMPMLRTATSMSDVLGNLLFYTNGIGIHNGQHQLIQNGDSLNPGQIADDYRSIGYITPNGIISVPHPVQNDKYYLFHQSITYTSDIAGMGEHLYYTLIDMNANSGLGQVEKKNQILVSDSLTSGELQMVKHANGRDWWLLQPIAWSNGFYTFLITADTIILTHKQYIGNSNRVGNAEWLGQSVFSPDGSKYARYDYKNDLDIFDFDRCTGLLSNPIHIIIQDTVDTFGGTYTGVAISPNSQYLYVSSYNLIYQFNMLASNITASKDTVAVHDGFMGAWVPTIFSFLSLGSDDKIYILSNENYLHTIESPDSSGINCNIQQRSVTTYNFNRPFLPNFPHYRTPALSGSPCDTLTGVEQAVRPNSNAPQLRLYPNPASTSISIEASQPIARVVLYNALGQQVLSLSGREQRLLELETRSLEKGSYFVSIWLGGEVLTKRVQILR